jgi:Flp pilus assembly protein TadD
MNNKSVIVTTLLIMLVVLGCKIPKEFLGDLKADPNPMELKGGKITVNVEGTFPAKYFNKNMVLTVVPVLKSKTTGATLRGEPKVFQGEKVKGNNKTINFKQGGKYEQTAVFDYDPQFDQSELYMEATAQIKKKSITFEPVKVADGLITTANLLYNNPSEIGSKVIPDQFQKTIEQKEQAEIKFLIQQSDIRSSETKNLVNLTNNIKNAKIDSNVVVKELNISSYASPDGGVELNEKLAGARENSTKKYVDAQIKKLKTQLDISANFTAQDWEGFKTLMESSNIQDKAVILNVLSMYSDPEQREKEIKNLSSAYTEIKESILPKLRRSKLTLTKEVIGKSDEQIAELIAKDPAQLSVEEMLYAATINSNLEYQKKVYQKVIQYFANDPRGYNNLGVVEYKLGNIDAANRNFTKALEIDKNNAVANFNKGSILLAQGNVKDAETYLGNAGGVGNELNLANGAVAIAKGDYKKAVSLYGNANTNNAALAKILNKDYSGARNVLENIQTPDVKTYYLQSIVAARTNDTKELVKAVTNTLNADNSYKAKFLNDPEFAAFINNAAFSVLFQ